MVHANDLLNIETVMVKTNLDLETLKNYSCTVCRAHASGFHFKGKESCSACSSFFRRAISMKKSFKCDQGNNRCLISFGQPKNCRLCRYNKCLEIGMQADAVQAGTNKVNIGRNYFTLSGIKRNNRFGKCIGLTPDIGNVAKKRTSPIKDEIPSPPNKQINKNVYNDPVTDPKLPNFFFDHEPLFNFDKISHLIFHHNTLDFLMKEEMRINQRRRVVFCKGNAKKLFTLSSTPSYTASDIRPMNFRQFTKSIRILILFIYEWMREWKFFGHLSYDDQLTFLRKCVLYHLVLDPAYISYSMGDLTKFVLPNGVFVSTIESDNSGWNSEKNFTTQNKKRIYWPLLQRVKLEIIQPMIDIKITFEEFCALKGILSLQASKHDVSYEARLLMQHEIESLIKNLHSSYKKQGKEESFAERLGNLLLLLSSLLDISDDFLESHHQVEFFNIWKLDDLLLQFLKKTS
uniref:Nuclear receptor domain-containing protein n=1 Tax=Rhabditophanes sp. KR3021 TaxID=114890 RepID=A0AC35TP79_9BILA